MQFQLCYECEICHGINFASRIHCQYCDTIPAKYSLIGKPAVIRENELVAQFVEVHNAFGVQRQNITRHVKHAIRTVPMDYYASE